MFKIIEAVFWSLTLTLVIAQLFVLYTSSKSPNCDCSQSPNKYESEISKKL